MIVKDFNEWILGFENLTKRQKLSCLEALQPGRERLDNCADIPQAVTEAQCDHCPHCDHDKLHKDGHASGLQRWRCTQCGKSFNALTNTPLARLRNKGQWLTNGEAMMAGLTVRATAGMCDVHLSTAFRWRHRFLELHRSAQSGNLSGIAECDATHFRHSEKGSRNLNRKPRKRGKDKAKSGRSNQLVAIITLRDRSGKGADRLALEKQMPAAEDLFKLHLQKDTLLITDGDHELCNAAKKTHPQSHLALPGKESRGVKGSPYHLQVTNAFHSNLKTWISRFNGVATAYLENYVGWHRHQVEQTYKTANDFITLSFNALAINPELTRT